MWIASKIGFFSFMQKSGCFHVRTRVRRDLENLNKAAALGEAAGIEKWPEADYRYRIRAGAVTLQKVFAALESSITYPNFKTEIANTPDQHDKLGAYHQTWHALARLQDGEADCPGSGDVGIIPEL